MSHEDAVALLPAYALGALEGETLALEAHLQTCQRCTALLASYLETTAQLGEAVAPVAPPPSLRAAVLAAGPRVPAAPLPLLPFRRTVQRFALPAAAALLVLSLGLATGFARQRQQLAQEHSQLALDERGLGLLTSTETLVERLAPVPPLAGDAHGHWYHRPDVATQVLVIEFMPPPVAGERYYGWLRRKDGSWLAAGPFTPDRQGYARLIILGSDGTDVQGALVTRQRQASASPTGQRVLSWGTLPP